MRTVPLLSFLLISATQAQGETVTLEMDDGAMFIRCVDLGGTASCEMVFADNSRMYSCIAFDGDGKPIATGNGISTQVLFADIDNSIIADVKCR